MVAQLTQPILGGTSVLPQIPQRAGTPVPSSRELWIKFQGPGEICKSLVVLVEIQQGHRSLMECARISWVCFDSPRKQFDCPAVVLAVRAVDGLVNQGVCAVSHPFPASPKESMQAVGAVVA